MPPRVIPRAFYAPPEALCYGVAGVGALAPFYLLFPGAEDRLAARTNRWAPRWERNISYFIPSVERGVQRMEPPVSRTVKKLEGRLPLEKTAQRVDRRIKNGIERAAKHQRHTSHAASNI